MLLVEKERIVMEGSAFVGGINLEDGMNGVKIEHDCPKLVVAS